MQAKGEDVLCRIDIAVVSFTTNGTCPFPHVEVFDITVAIAALAAYLTAWVELTDEYEVLAVPFTFV